MDAIIQFVSEPFNWIVVATVFISFSRATIGHRLQRNADPNPE
jgi:hypothetical protein